MDHVKDMEDMTRDELLAFLRECGLNIRKCRPGEEPGFHPTGLEEPGDWAEWGMVSPEEAINGNVD